MNFKKTIIATAAAMLLTACSSPSIQSSLDDIVETTQDTTETIDTTTTKDATPSSAPTLGSSYPKYTMAYVVDEETVSVPEGETSITGYAGQTFHTAFFDYKVNDAALFDRYESFEASEGNLILAVNVTVSNPYKYDVTMFDTDFVISWWESDGVTAPDDNHAYDVLNDDTSLVTGDILPLEYTLRYGESATGDLVFEVPEEYRYFSLFYVEVYSNQDEGNAFYLDFELE